jgi:prepilin-type processing-associated H-X9-DG protein
MILLFADIALSQEIKFQRGVPEGILDAVFRFQYGNRTGTCFSLEADGRQYIITARHLVQGIRDHDSVRVFLGQRWQEIKVKAIFPRNPKTDIVALVSNRKVAQRMDIPTAEAAIPIGQELYFMGFPFGLSTQIDGPLSKPIPFINHAFLSAVDSRFCSGNVLYLDGHNNPGFSGGPVVSRSHDEKQPLQIVGVLSSYRVQLNRKTITEKTDVHNGAVEKKSSRFVQENSGILVAYHISEIIKAIRLNPTGLPMAAEGP